jgi:hypothetical protein
MSSKVKKVNPNVLLAEVFFGKEFKNLRSQKGIDREHFGFAPHFVAGIEHGTPEKNRPRLLRAIDRMKPSDDERDELLFHLNIFCPERITVKIWTDVKHDSKKIRRQKLMQFAQLKKSMPGRFAR